MGTEEMFQTGNCAKALGWVERSLPEEWQKKAKVALATVQDRGEGVGEVCRASHEGAGRTRGECFNCSPSGVEREGMT